jgi:hypothetical protein
MFTIIPVILAGGEGRKLWPLSSEQSPKQFLPLGKNGESLFASAYKRAMMVAPSSHIVVVTKEFYARQTWQEIHKIDRQSKSQLLLEPQSRNTAAAVTMAAIHALNYFEHPVLWVMPSDSYVEKPRSLINAVLESAQVANSDKIVTFGTIPLRKDGNLGHMICGEESAQHKNLFNINLFIEKPQGQRLEWFMQQKNCLWDSGMFMFSGYTILKHIKSRGKFLVDAASHAYKNAKHSQFGLMADATSYNNLPQFSIDKLVMEDNINLMARPVDVGLSDVGTWQNLQELSSLKMLNRISLAEFSAYFQSAA